VEVGGLRVTRPVVGMTLGSIEDLRVFASRFMIRKRPSIESYVAPVGGYD